MLTQKQLVQILGNPESYNIEITTSTTNMDKFCQAICAFSNDLPGDDKSGYLIIGAEDNGKLSGLRVDDGLLLKMTNIRTDGNILPQLSSALFWKVAIYSWSRSNRPNFLRSDTGDVFGYG